MAGEGDQHRVLDIVVQSIAFADAFQRDAGDRRDQLDQAGFCTAIPPLHVAREKSAESVGREFGNGYHDRFPLSTRLRRQPNSVACIYLGGMTAPTAPALHCAAASPMVRASTASYLGFFEPVMCVRLVVEGLDFHVSATAIERLRFLKRPIGLEPERAHSKIARMRFQHFENSPPTPRPRASAATHMRLTSPIIRSFSLSAPHPTGRPPRRARTKTPAGGVSSSASAGMLFAGSKPVSNRPASSRKYCSRHQRASALSGASTVI